MFQVLSISYFKNLFFRKNDHIQCSSKITIFEENVDDFITLNKSESIPDECVKKNNINIDININNFLKYNKPYLLKYKPTLKDTKCVKGIKRYQQFNKNINQPIK